VPLQEDVAIEAFTEQLVSALEAEGRVKTICWDSLPQSLRQAPFGGHEEMSEALKNEFVSAKIAAWITAHEENYRFVVLRGNYGDADWNRICVAQGDCVLALAAESPATSPAVDYSVSEDEQALFWQASHHGNFSHRVELVMLHDQVAPYPLPSGTTRWLDPRPRIERWHHVRVSVASDYERIVRHLAGSAVGMVLGGGGSRGLAHLGVIKACKELGVPIDSIGGTSQGAFMSAIWAATQDLDEMQTRVQTFSQGMGSTLELMMDMTLPINSYFHGGKFSAAVRDCIGIGDACFEDLWIPTFAIVTNISTTEMEVRRRGTVWSHVRASMTVIGLLPPMWDNGDLIADGGYANNLPVDVMREVVHAGKIIAVDVENKDISALQNCDNMVDSSGGVSGYKLFFLGILSKLFDVGAKWPTAQVLHEWLGFMSSNRDIRRFLKEGYIDLYICNPGISQFALLDYHKFDVIVQGGYDFAKHEIIKWQRKSSRAVLGRQRKFPQVGTVWSFLNSAQMAGMAASRSMTGLSTLADTAWGSEGPAAKFSSIEEDECVMPTFTDDAKPF